jgi:alkylation response protein AidB-like acyl-CoA dehydrogenase
MDMLDTIRNGAAATEAAGRLVPSTVAALVEAGSFKLWVPENYSGAGTSLQAGLDAIAEIARADGAAGWCVRPHDRAPCGASRS